MRTNRARRGSKPRAVCPNQSKQSKARKLKLSPSNFYGGPRCPPPIKIGGGEPSRLAKSSKTKQSKQSKQLTKSKASKANLKKANMLVNKLNKGFPSAQAKRAPGVSESNAFKKVKQKTYGSNRLLTYLIIWYKVRRFTHPLPFPTLRFTVGLELWRLLIIGDLRIR